jgi:hypothetical protein
MLDQRFNAFLASCKAAEQRAKKMRRLGQTAEGQERLRRLGRDMAAGA